ncbi:Serine/threonine-protein kinase RIO3 [Halotydeus destructor]|nr:Serine/threonine-protein kinase RIO3 [Halotydeus destructor]
MSTSPSSSPNAWASRSTWCSPGTSTSKPENEVSLQDVMSEQLATHLQIEEEAVYIDKVISASERVEQPRSDLKDAFKFEINGEELIDTTNDELLAQMMQRDFDKEHDAHLSREESKYNGTSKLSMKFDKYKRLPSEYISDSDTEEEDDTVYRALDKFEEAEKNNAAFTIGRSGVIMQGNKVLTTKHDLTTAARKNACRVMNFNSNVSTGDGGSFDMQLSNNVYNSLKKHATQAGKRMARLHEKKDKSTAERVMDEKSRLIMFKLVNRGILEEINGCINTGKEANVYHGIGSNIDLQIPVGEVAIKLFTTTLSEFKHRDAYIKDDFRFRHRFSKQNPRKVVHLWAEKEMHNLKRIKKEGIQCPEVVALKNHILVMSFIGSNGKGAPTLKEAINQLSQTQANEAYHATVAIMKDLWTKCDLVHADLSEFNLLWHRNSLWVIDVGQAVMSNHPNCLEFLIRDCHNIVTFFTKHGVETLSSSELFTSITEKPLEGAEGVEMLAKIEEYERDEEILTVGKSEDGESFEQMFEKSKVERHPVPSAVSSQLSPTTSENP